MDATYKGRNNTYSFKWKQMRIIVVPSKVEENTPLQEEVALISIPLKDDELKLGANKEVRELQKTSYQNDVLFNLKSSKIK